MSCYRAKLTKLIFILFVGAPFQANADTQVVACFESNNDQPLIPESQEEVIPNLKALISTTNQDCILVNSISFDFAQTLNIGSQGSGAGAGKITFNPLTIYKNIDSLSPALFLKMATGTHFKSVNVFFRQTTSSQSTAGSPAVQNYTTALMVQFGLVAIKTIKFSANTGDAKLNNNEVVALEYGGVKMSVFGQSNNGVTTLLNRSGWDRVNNVPSENPEGIPQLTPQ